MAQFVLADSLMCRVLYFIGNCVAEAVLYVVMRWGRGEPVSTVLFAVAKCGSWSVVPLLDAVPQHIAGPKALRSVLVLLMLLTGYNLVWCKANTAECRAFYNDFSCSKVVEGSYSGPGMRPLLKLKTDPSYIHACA